jgi:hypothetical protein
MDSSWRELELLLSELRAVRYRGEVLPACGADRAPAARSPCPHCEIESLREQHDRVRARPIDTRGDGRPPRDARLCHARGAHVASPRRRGRPRGTSGEAYAPRRKQYVVSRVDGRPPAQARQPRARNTRADRVHTPRAELPEPRIPGSERYRERLASMGDHVKVNLGCGEQPWADYINVDARELRYVDVVADARGSRSQPGSITSSPRASRRALPRVSPPHPRVENWKDPLCPRGFLRIICPTVGAMLARVPGTGAWASPT